MSDTIYRQDAIDALIPIVKSASLRNRNVYSVAKKCMSAIEQLPSAEPKGIPIEWLEEKLTNHPELPYAVTDGIIAVLELWNNDCGVKDVEGEEE